MLALRLRIDGGGIPGSRSRAVRPDPGTTMVTNAQIQPIVGVRNTWMGSARRGWACRAYPLVFFCFSCLISGGG